MYDILWPSKARRRRKNVKVFSTKSDLDAIWL